MHKNLLIVDDETPILRVLAPVFRADGWQVFEAENAEQALDCSTKEVLDLVLLDLGLPDADGKEIISSLRRNDQMAIIVLSARHQESEKVAALDAGADDYVDKPFNIEVLRARIRAAERRVRQGSASPRRFIVGELELDTQTHRASIQGMDIRLSPKEFELLKTLIEHAGQVITHRRLLIAGWGSPKVDQQYLRGYIALLRQKIEEDPSEPKIIISEPGVGYRMAL